jgi:oxalate decarboxylase/phosphoglucose isomerase-like protein (cupin superfamily)
MRAAIVIRALALVAVLPVGSALAQSAAAKPKPTDLSNAEIQDAVKRGMAALTPGVSVNDRLVSLADISKYNVAVAVVARPAGPDPRSLSHDKITEIYYVLKGSGTQLTGTLVNGTHQDTSKTIGPGMSSDAPLQNTTAKKLGPGDMQIIPPGLGHRWQNIDIGGIQYLVIRVDPEKVLQVEAPQK